MGKGFTSKGGEGEKGRRERKGGHLIRFLDRTYLFCPTQKRKGGGRKKKKGRKQHGLKVNSPLLGKNLHFHKGTGKKGKGGEKKREKKKKKGELVNPWWQAKILICLWKEGGGKGEGESNFPPPFLEFARKYLRGRGKGKKRKGEGVSRVVHSLGELSSVGQVSCHERKGGKGGGGGGKRDLGSHLHNHFIDKGGEGEKGREKYVRINMGERSNEYRDIPGKRKRERKRGGRGNPAHKSEVLRTCRQ